MVLVQTQAFVLRSEWGAEGKTVPAKRLPLSPPFRVVTKRPWIAKKSACFIHARRETECGPRKNVGRRPLHA